MVRGNRRDDAIEQLSPESLRRVHARENSPGLLRVGAQPGVLPGALAREVVGLSHRRCPRHGAHRHALGEGRRQTRGEQDLHVLARRRPPEPAAEHIDEAILPAEDQVPQPRARVPRRRRLAHARHRGRRGLAHAFAAAFSCASTAAIAAMLTMSATSTPRWRTWTGRFRPRRIGPIASAPASRHTSLYAAFADWRSGKMSTFGFRTVAHGYSPSSSSGTTA